MEARPRARQEGIVVKAVGDELLVYDLERHRAHSLNPVAAAVWRQCDGRRDPAALAAAVRAPDGTAVPELAVRYALGELGRAGLLAGSAAEPGVTRRDLLRRLGATAAALPLLTSIVVPTAAQAQSPQCLQEGESCSVIAQGCCRPFECVGGICQEE
jgi:hypothetical protein